MVRTLLISESHFVGENPISPKDEAKQVFLHIFLKNKTKQNTGELGLPVQNLNKVSLYYLLASSKPSSASFRGIQFSLQKRQNICAGCD